MTNQESVTLRLLRTNQRSSVSWSFLVCINTYHITLSTSFPLLISARKISLLIIHQITDQFWYS